jgi:hypothetical protein
VPYLAIGCRAGLVTVFLIAVAGKAMGRRPFREFADSIARMRVIPPRAAAGAAAVVVSAEALVVVLAASPAHAAGVAGCTLAALLSVTFSSAIAVSVRRGNRAPCRCFGRSAKPLGPRHFIRNAIVLTVSALGAAACAGSGTAHIAGAVVAAGAGLFLGLAIAAYDEVAELVTPSH